MSSNAIFPPGCSDVTRAGGAPARSPAWSAQETGLTAWFTGLSGAGKTTLANAVARPVAQSLDVPTVLLDADILRQGFLRGAGIFACRKHSTRRMCAVASSGAGAGKVGSGLRRGGAGGDDRSLPGHPAGGAETHWTLPRGLRECSTGNLHRARPEGSLRAGHCR